MLHAFARNKSKAFNQYLPTRNPSEQRINSEDEITSLVFGPLEFLSASDNWKIWKAILQNNASLSISGSLPPDFLADFSPTSVTYDFWPKKNRVEPDLVVEFLNDLGKSRSLLIELKWDAPPSGEDQLRKQWLNFQDGKHASSLHLFISKRALQEPADLHLWSCREAGASTENRLRQIRWHDFKHELVQQVLRRDASMSLRKWCELTSGFLHHLRIRPFVGFFRTLQLAAAIEEEVNPHLVFWSK
jgi:hypothetical protein